MATGRRSLAVLLILILFLFLNFYSFTEVRAGTGQWLPLKIKIQKLSDDIFYPVVTSAIQKRSKEKINRTFYSHAKDIQKTDRKYKKQYEHDRLISAAGPYYASTRPFVRYNNGRLLSVSFIDESYTGGAHGMHYEKVYNFDNRSGKEYRLSDIIKNKEELQRVNTFVKKRMIDLKDRGRYDFFADAFESIDNRNGQYYFNDQGIVLIFQEYEVAPYSNGIIHLNVPYKVFK